MLVIAPVLAVRMDPDRRVIGDAAIAADGGRLVAIGKAERINACRVSPIEVSILAESATRWSTARRPT